MDPHKRETILFVIDLDYGNAAARLVVPPPPPPDQNFWLE